MSDGQIEQLRRSHNLEIEQLRLSHSYSQRKDNLEWCMVFAYVVTPLFGMIAIGMVTLGIGVWWTIAHDSYDNQSPDYVMLAWLGGGGMLSAIVASVIGVRAWRDLPDLKKEVAGMAERLKEIKKEREALR